MGPGQPDQVGGSPAHSMGLELGDVQDPLQSISMFGSMILSF